MTSIPSVGDTERWTERFLKYQTLQADAQRRNDIPAANRHVEKVTEALDALAKSGKEGRDQLEKLLEDSDPSIRGRAARRVLKWNPERAVPVLVRLLFERFGPPRVPVESVGIRTEAEHALLNYFGLDIFDPTELPDRLAAMGVALPDEVARRLRREN